MLQENRGELARAYRVACDQSGQLTHYGKAQVGLTRIGTVQARIDQVLQRLEKSGGGPKSETAKLLYLAEKLGDGLKSSEIEK